MTTLPTIQQMQRAYRRSDTSYDGIFYLGVRTTGIFCKPSCGARKPRPQNVAYFSTPREALFAGFRPCKRCRPMAASGSPPGWVRELLEHVERQARITDARLRELRIDPARARRYFQKHYGMTFQAYCRGRRLGNALQQIRRGRPLDDVTLGHGYESHSGFRSAFAKRFGAPPGKMRDGDAVVVTWIESPLGPLVAAAAGDAVVLLEFTERRMLDAQFRTIRKYFRSPIIPGENEVLRNAQAGTRGVFRGKAQVVHVCPVRIPGSAFQQRVWQRAPPDPLRQFDQLPGARCQGRVSARDAGGGQNQRTEPDRHRGPLPPGGGEGRRAQRVRRRDLAEAGIARAGARGAPVRSRHALFSGRSPRRPLIVTAVRPWRARPRSPVCTG